MIRHLFLRRRAYLAVWIGLALAMDTAFGKPAQAQNNKIERVTVASESRDSVIFDIVYIYSGNQGGNVFMSIVMAQNGQSSANYAYTPGGGVGDTAHESISV